MNGALEEAREQYARDNLDRAAVAAQLAIAQSLDRLVSYADEVCQLLARMPKER